MIPIRDRNPSGTFPAVTVTLIVACVGAFLLELSTGSKIESFISSFGLVPERVTYGIDRERSAGVRRPSRFSPRCSCTAAGCT